MTTAAPLTTTPVSKTEGKKLTGTLGPRRTDSIPILTPCDDDGMQ